MTERTFASPRGLWARVAEAWQRPTLIELSERTLEDIGAPDWLRAQARSERLGPWFGVGPWA